QSVLGAYLNHVRKGELSDTRARALALEWMAELDTTVGGDIWVFDRDFNILAGSYKLEQQADLSTLLDYKGRPLAASVYEEVRGGSHAFAIYRLSDLAGGDAQLRYAYVSYVPEWEWIIAV